MLTEISPSTLQEFTSRSSQPDAPPSVQPSMKIMRRGMMKGDLNTTGSSDETIVSSDMPSQATSEMGDYGRTTSGLVSPSESVSTKDKSTLTREEREAKYKETRERIFKGFEETETGEAEGNEKSTAASRASSTTGKNKKKSKKNNDDGFEARSAYNVIYPSRQGEGYDQAGMAPQFYPYMPPNPQMMQGQMQQGFPQGMPPLPPFQMPMYGDGNIIQQSNGYQAFSPYHQQMQQPYLSQVPPQMQQMPMMPQQGQIPSPAMSANSAQLARVGSQISDPQWNPNGFPSPYPNYGQQNGYFPQQQQQMMPGYPDLNPAAMPYHFPQMPHTQVSSGGYPSHAMPINYAQNPTFNPQIRSFVPGGYPPVPGNGYLAQPMMSPGPYQQQGHAVQQSPGHQYPRTSSHGSTPRKPSNQSQHTQSSGQSGISKWGTPSTLPPKPPPPAHSSTGAPQSVPTYQNGTYS